MYRSGQGIALDVLLRAAALAAAALLVAFLCAPRVAYAATEAFALLADTHLGLPNQNAYEEVERALLWAEELDALKAVCVAGDLTDRGDPVSYSEWEYLCDSILQDAVAMQALGDHDTGKNGAYLKVDPSLTVANGYRGFLDASGGKSTEFRQFKNANVMTFGGIRARGHSVVTGPMLKQLNARLQKTVRQGKIAIVVCHYPYTAWELNMRSKFMAVLRSYPNVIYVSGHKHRYSKRQHCQSVSPSCSITPYRRAGALRSRKYSFTSVGVDACSTYRSGNYSYASSLSVTASGAVTLKAWNISLGRVLHTRTFKQAKSSITVKARVTSESYPKSARFTYRVTFSDGGTYGGVKSGSTFSLRAGKSKRLGGIPSGVLVSVKQVSGPKNWTRARARSLEVSKAPQLMNMNLRYTAPAAHLRAATI